MKKRNIKTFVFCLALSQALTLGGCKKNNNEVIKTDEPTQIEETINKNENEKNYVIFANSNLYDDKGNIVGTTNNSSFVKVLSQDENYSYIEFEDKPKGLHKTKFYVTNNCIYYVIDLNKNAFKQVMVGDRDKYVKDDGTPLYNKDGFIIKFLYANTPCLAIAENGEYTLVTSEDGTEGYIFSGSLIPMYNNIETLAYLHQGSSMYYDKQLTQEFNQAKENKLLYVFYMDENYALVGNADTKEFYYVKSSDLELIHNARFVNSYMYFNKDAIIYGDKNFNEQNTSSSAFQLGYVHRMTNEFVEIIDMYTRQHLFVKPEDIVILGPSFIDIDLGDQRISCYIDGTVAGSWGTRSGKDGTPTHEGAFDIDWKAEEWEFTTYPGSFAHNWIPYNEYGEGIHDLIGDDEANYGNDWYHSVGSHGCVRVPLEASDFVYDNYDIGSMVLVHK